MIKKEFKDFYAVLGVSPSASLHEIKMAYRNLVMKYHPDRSPGDHLAYSRFLQISEAWEVLQDPVKRKQYHDVYFYGHFVPSEKIVNAVSIITDCRKFQTILEQVDTLRISPRLLTEKARQVLSPAALQYLTKSSNEQTNEEITAILLKCCLYLPYPAVEIICKNLQTIQHVHAPALAQIGQVLRQKKRTQTWKHYEVWVYLALVLLFCGIIFFSR